MAEILKIREITIDTMQHKDFNIKEEELKLIRFYQNDLNSAKLLINVTHDKVVTDFSSATSVQIAFLKPDCKRVFQDVQNVNQMQGKYYVVLSTQTLIAYGNVIAQLRFTFPNNKVIETCKFAFTVDESIMSDDAMKSTNEFPVIQKAIEAGKKFEGVDIDGIIAAGELAKGALPKTGGTMTGNLTFQSDTEANIPFRTKTTNQEYAKLYANPTRNRLGVYSTKNAKNVWDYDGDTDSFNVNTNTNLLKKTGDTMTGNLVIGKATTGVIWRDNENMDYGIITNSDGKQLYMRDWKRGKTLFSQDDNGFNVYADNLLRKTGDTATGPMIFRHNFNQETADGLKGVNIVVNSSVNKWSVGPKINGSADWSNEFAMNLTNGEVTVASLKTKKDGRATLALTADATAGSTSPQLATRRGNTVTVNLDLIRNTGSSSLIVTTLPQDMAPVDSYTFDAISTDGTPSRVLIRANGEIFLDVTGKRYRILATYVCN